MIAATNPGRITSIGYDPCTKPGKWQRGFGVQLVSCWLRLWALALGVAGMCWATGACAQGAVDAAGVQWISAATRAAAHAGRPDAQQVALPDAWNKPGRSGLWRYTVQFDAPGTIATQWGLYIPRVGNRAVVVLNGRSVGQLGGFDGDLSDYAQRPHFFYLPRDAMRPGTNELEITVQGEKARYAGLSSMMVGPVVPVRRAFFWRELLQTWGSFAIVVVATVFALASGALAVVTRDRVFVLFALASLFCGIRTTYALVVSTPFDFRLWNLLVDTAFAGYLACLCLFCLEVLKTRRRWVLMATVALLVATAVLVPMYAFGRLAWARQAWTMTMVVYSLSLSTMVMYIWWKTRTTPARVLGVAGALSVAMGVHDHVLVFYTADGFSSFALVRYSLLLFMGAMAWVLVDRYAGQARREDEIRSQLASDLELRTTQLLQQFEAQRQLIEAAAHQRERERLIHDLHDGMGLQLNTLLGMVEKGRLQSDDLTLEVRTAIDQMRMLVDSSESFDGDFMELLGHIRYRIEGRLLRSGIELAWVNHLPDRPGRVDTSKAIALQHLVFELATNVIKHSGARRMQVALQLVEPAGMVRMEVSDDGRGFDAAAGHAGMGRRSIQRRVDDLGGVIEPARAPGVGSLYVFSFPYPNLPVTPEAQVPLT
jgi:signal transduction histidine kinase